MNDNAPVFPYARYYVDIPENEPAGTFVAAVRATDRDSGSNGNITYLLPAGEGMGKFVVDPKTGVVRTTQPLDREALRVNSYTFTIIASDSGSTALTTKTTVVVRVLDVNDCTPTFSHPSSAYRFTRQENQERKTLITILVFDCDDGPYNNKLAYTILSGNEDNNFAVSSNGGLLAVLVPLDREQKSFYSLRVQVCDSPLNPNATLCSVTTMNITVLDVNDNSPVFNNSHYSGAIAEDADVGDSVLRVHATDADGPTYGTVHYQMTDPTGKFAVDRNTGVIRVAGALDREDLPAYSLTVYALDNDPNPRQAHATVTIAILDVNDFTPTFTKALYAVNISAAIKLNSPVFNMTAFDIDSSDNGRIIYSFAQPNADFTVNPTTGVVSTTRRLSPTGNTQSFLIEIVAMDSGTPQLNSSANLSIGVLPASQSPPRFLEDLNVILYRLGSIRANDRITQASAITDNTSVVLSYSIASVAPPAYDGFFSMNPVLGVVTAMRDITLSPTARIQIVVRATAARVGQSASMTIQLQRDLLQYTFLYFVSATEVGISESLPKDDPVLIVEAKSALIQTVPRYSIVAGNDAGVFRIDSTSGTIRTNTALDFEAAQSYIISVMAEDVAGFSRPVIAAITVNVLNVNDNPPVWHSYPTGPVTVNESLPATAYVATVQATDRDKFPLFYRIVNQPTTRFNISQRGEITLGHLGVDYEQQKTYTLNVTCTDGLHTISRLVTVNIRDSNDNPPVFWPKSLSKTIPENAAPGWRVARVRATDADEGTNSQLTYRLVNNINNSLAINSTSGEVTLLKTIPYHAQANVHTVTISATDHGEPPLSATIVLLIDVLDINDNDPVFSQPSYIFNISESTAVQQGVGSVQATDDDAGSNSRITYRIVPESRHFHMNQGTGGIFLVRGVDHEAAANFLLNVSASDGGTPQRTTYVQVTIYILDANDNPPQFTKPEYVVGALESTPLHMELIRVSATDKDEGSNAEVSYKISAGDPLSVFDLNKYTGRLFLERPLDSITRTGKDTVTLDIEATDGVHVARAKINVVIFPSNQTNPVFTHRVYTVNVSEVAPRGTLLLTVIALSPKHGLGVRYFLADNATVSNRRTFSVDDMSGEITLRGVNALDYETARRVEFFVKAVDQDNADRVEYAKVVINVANANEYRPQFDSPSYEFSVEHGLAVGTLIGTVEASDDDADSTVTYYLATTNHTDNGESVVELNRQSGQIRTLAGFSQFKRNKLVLVVVATDGVENKTATVTITIGGNVDNQTSSPSSTVLIAAVIIVVILLALVVVVVIVVIRKRSQHNKSLSQLDSQYGYAPAGGNVAGRKGSSRALLGSTSTTLASNLEHGSDSPPLHNGGAVEELSMQRLSSGTGSTYIHNGVAAAPAGYHGYGVPPAYPMVAHEHLHEFGEEGAGEAWGGLGGGGAMDMNTMIFSRLAEIEADEHEAIMDGVRAFNADTLSHAGSIGSVARFVDEICSHSGSTPNLRQLAKDLSALSAGTVKKPVPSPRTKVKLAAQAGAGLGASASELSVVSPTWSSSEPSSERSDLIGSEEPGDCDINCSMSDVGAPEEIVLSPQTSPSKGYWSTTSNDQEVGVKGHTVKRVEREERQDALDKMISFGDEEDEEDVNSVMTEDILDEMRFSDYEAEEV